MRAITVHRPWSFAIAYLGKGVENRTRRTNYRGEIAIHAGKVWSERGFAEIGRITGAPLTFWDSAETREAQGIVAVATLADCHHADQCQRHVGGQLCSMWAEADAWHLALRSTITLDEPVPCRGALGLWTVPDDVEAAVRAQIAGAP
jgi:hypothetical protein